MVQSCAEASPAKWHLAHTAWFFESFILREFLPGYKLFNADFPWLFNSYYRSFAAVPGEAAALFVFATRTGRGACAIGSTWTKGSSGCWRRACRAGGAEANRTGREPRRAAPGAAADRYSACVLHQSAAAGLSERVRRTNRLSSRCSASWRESAATSCSLRVGWWSWDSRERGFCYDNELPRHRVWLEPLRWATAW